MEEEGEEQDATAAHVTLLMEVLRDPQEVCFQLEPLWVCLGGIVPVGMSRVPVEGVSKVPLVEVVGSVVVVLLLGVSWIPLVGGSKSLLVEDVGPVQVLLEEV